MNPDRRKKLRRYFERSRLVGTLISLVLAFLIGGVILALSGYNPITTYAQMLAAIFGSLNGMMQTLLKAQPLLFCGLAIGLTFKAGMLNIGATGQLYIGALCGLIMAVGLPGLPAVLHIPLCLLAGAVGGALWAFPTVLIKIKTGTSEVITALMMNYIAQLFVSFMINYPLRDHDSQAAQSLTIPQSAQLPKLVGTQQISIGLLMGLVLAVLLQFMLNRTKTGFQMEMSGANLDAAKAAGIPSVRTMVSTMMISGGIAGIAGVIEVTGTHLKLIQGFAGNYGLESISVAVMGGSPLMIVVSSLFFGALKAGISALNYTTKLSSHFIGVIQGIVIMFVAAPSLFKQFTDFTQGARKRLAAGRRTK